MMATAEGAHAPGICTRRVAAERVAATNAVAERFFGEQAEAIARACQAMARCFQQSGRLFVGGDGAQRSDVAHVVVEFLHPVVVGKRALPAMALPDVRSGEAERVFATLARRGDLLLLMSAGDVTRRDASLLAAARAQGVLAIVLTGVSARAIADADHLFAVPSADACIVQETHELLYHVLWELVHVFLDHRQASA